MKKENSS